MIFEYLKNWANSSTSHIDIPCDISYDDIPDTTGEVLIGPWTQPFSETEKSVSKIFGWIIDYPMIIEQDSYVEINLLGGKFAIRSGGEFIIRSPNIHHFFDWLEKSIIRLVY